MCVYTQLDMRSITDTDRKLSTETPQLQPFRMFPKYITLTLLTFFLEDHYLCVFNYPSVTPHTNEISHKVIIWAKNK